MLADGGQTSSLTRPLCARDALFIGYLVGAALMLLAAVWEAIIGVKAERVSLEEIAAPLSAETG